MIYIKTDANKHDIEEEIPSLNRFTFNKVNDVSFTGELIGYHYTNDYSKPFQIGCYWGMSSTRDLSWQRRAMSTITSKGYDFLYQYYDSYKNKDGQYDLAIIQPAAEVTNPIYYKKKFKKDENGNDIPLTIVTTEVSGIEEVTEIDEETQETQKTIYKTLSYNQTLDLDENELDADGNPIILTQGDDQWEQRIAQGTPDSNEFIVDVERDNDWETAMMRQSDILCIYMVGGDIASSQYIAEVERLLKKMHEVQAAETIYQLVEVTNSQGGIEEHMNVIQKPEYWKKNVVICVEDGSQIGIDTMRRRQWAESGQNGSGAINFTIVTGEVAFAQTVETAYRQVRAAMRTDWVENNYRFGEIVEE